MRRPATELVSTVDQEPQQEQVAPEAGEAIDGRGDGARMKRRPVRAEGGQRGRHVTVRGLNAWYGAKHAVKGLDIEFAPNQVTAIIGPSGCGKSTMVRCLNRMHEEVPHARAEGHVRLDGGDFYGPEAESV